MYFLTIGGLGTGAPRTVGEAANEGAARMARAAMKPATTSATMLTVRMLRMRCMAPDYTPLGAEACHAPRRRAACLRAAAARG